LLTAILLFSLIAIDAERWYLAAFLLVLGLALKPIIIVFLLLAGVLYRPLWLPLIVGLVLVILFPFFTQHPSYVIEQYQQSFLLFQRAEAVGSQMLSHWAHFFGMLSQLNVVDIAPHTQFITKSIMAVVTLGIAYYIKENFSKREAIILIYAVSTVYLMLLSSRTENNTYVMLAPALGFFIVEALQKKHFIQLGALIFIALGITESHSISKAFTPTFDSWCAPLMTCFFTFFLLQKIFPTLYSSVGKLFRIRSSY
jgi:hypothetical protein